MFIALTAVQKWMVNQMAFEDIKKGLEKYINARHGHWIFANKDYVCSECFTHSDKMYNECPHCEAKMDGDKNEEKDL